MGGLASKRPKARALLEGGLVAYATLLGGAVRLYDLGGHSLWLDEVLMKDATGTLADAVSLGYHPPLSHLLVWAARAVFSDGPAALRAVSAVLGTLLIPATYVLARRTLGRPGLAAAAALVVAVLPGLVWHSRDARMYALPYFAIELLPIRGYVRLVLPALPLLAVVVVGACALPLARWPRAGGLLTGGLGLLFVGSLLLPLGRVYTREVEPWNDACALVFERA